MNVKRVQLVVPMAGLGMRFVEANYKTLKPLIPIHGVPMIRLVIDNLMSDLIGHVVVVAQRETVETVDLRAILSDLQIPVTIVAVDKLTEGPADTVLQARQVLNDNLPLVIANSDQYVDANLEKYYGELMAEGNLGTILTMEDDNPKWSYVELNGTGLVINVKEKVVISNQATVGVYGYSKAQLAWNAFSEMWQANDRTNGEFYVAPAYNYLIKAGVPVTTTNLGPVRTVMYGLGTPEDLESFIELPVSKKAASKASIYKN